MLKKEKGFLLIELLLVLLGAVLFLNISLSTKHSLERAKLQRGARELESFIRNCQDLSYNQGQVYYVTMFADKVNMVKGMRVSDRFDLPQGIHIKTTSFDMNRIRFTKSLAPNKGGTIYLESKHYKLRMTVLLATGRVKIYPMSKK